MFSYCVRVLEAEWSFGIWFGESSSFSSLWATFITLGLGDRINIPVGLYVCNRKFCLELLCFGQQDLTCYVSKMEWYYLACEYPESQISGRHSIQVNVLVPRAWAGGDFAAGSQVGICPSLLIRTVPWTAALVTITSEAFPNSAFTRELLLVHQHCSFTMFHYATHNWHHCKLPAFHIDLLIWTEPVECSPANKDPQL